MQDIFKYKFFISYTTIDKEICKELLLEIENTMKDYGEVYIDLLHNNNPIEPQKNVIEELINSNVLIVLNTNNIKKSKWVNLELEKALERNIQVIFLSIQDILDDNFDLLEKIYDENSKKYLKEVNWARELYEPAVHRHK